MLKWLKKGFNKMFSDKKEENDSLSIRLLRIMKKASLLGASDIHILPYETFSEIRFRIDGDLVLYRELNTMDHLRIINLLKLWSGLDSSNHIIVQEGQIVKELPGDKVKSEFRVSFVRSEYGEKAVIRILGRTLISMDRKVLGFTAEDDLRLENVIRKRRGLILLCGATGSGKTTTIYSFLNNLKNNAVNITTIEDPIEYVLEGITQTSVNPSGGYTYESAIKAVLRQDPDILYVGEIRDTETASAAINAVLTGHMVFSSVHSENIVTSFLRLFKLGINSQQLSESVSAMICQTLVKRVCRKCATRRHLTDEEKSILGISGDPIVYTESQSGCENCRGFRSNGRVAAYELFIPSEFEKDLLSENFSTVTLNNIMNSHGTINDSLRRLLCDGIISVEEALREIK